MSKEIYISSTPHETRLAIVEDEALTEIYYERENEYTLAGSIYNGRVTRVLPGMQSSFVDIGLERDAFLYITDFLEEAPDSEEFDTAPAGERAPRQNQIASGGGQAEPGRSGASGRGSERGGRGRRGGRDRNGDRQGGGDVAARQPSADRESPSNGQPAGLPKDAANIAEVGEGAPGADGGRRWRGRRGRRRGRGTPGQPGEPLGVASPSADVDEEVLVEGGAPEFELDAAEGQEFDAPIDAAPATRSEDRPREGFGDRGNRDRGGQRRDGRGFDGPRPDRDRRPERGPREFAPPRYADGGETRGTGPIADAYPDESGIGAEPTILPGESLSKYRKGEERAEAAPAASQAIPVTLAPPANLYTVAAGWDGGDVLPGESLSRRRPAGAGAGSQTRSERPRREFEREPRREGRDNRGRDRAEFRGNSPATSTEHHAQPAAEVVPEIAAEAVAQPVAFEAPAAIASAAPVVLNTTSVPPPPRVEAEYEPTEAAASYRVDPLPRTEYRQSAPVLEPEAALEPVAEVPQAYVPHEEPAVPAREITAISAGGEMHSEPVEAIPAASHPAPMEVHEPASPIHHEGAVVSPEPIAEAGIPGAVPFSLGEGRIDEEVLEDEESEGATLQASSIEEIDDLEEETLEGAADLGTMLREMSIDQITRPSPEADDEEEEDEDDDLEEDDLEEDDLEEEEEEDDEEDGQDGYPMEARTVSEETGEAARDEAGGGEFSEGRFAEDSGEEGAATASSQQRDPSREPQRDGDRRGGRRDGRRGQRGDRDRGRSSRPGHSNGHGRGRTMQSTNLPAISDLLKPGQEILVQIAKEPIAKKGARITSHIALPGRFLVFMPTVNHTGVSRKIESDGERRRLKEILLSEKGEASGGFIVRTAAEGASEDELRSDLRFLLNLWADIKARSESSKSPALIYHDLNLIERILRDQVTDNFSAIWVDTESEYERVLRFLQRFQPSLIRRVKLYTKETPLFEQFGITEEINKALRSKVWLKSGGSIVINQTEALVAIDINTGKYVGKTARLEDTIVKTNLDAIPEIVRQIRLRDLGGIIIIDFIDMDERKNRNRVMAALEEELKSDRAPSKVLQFNDFGLVAITRKRVKQSLERTLSTTCAVCTGTGMVKSPITVCNDIYIEMRKMHKHLERGDVMLRVHPEVVKQLKSSGAKWLQEMEEMCGKTILVKSDPSLHPEQFDIH